MQITKPGVYEVSYTQVVSGRQKVEIYAEDLLDLEPGQELDIVDILLEDGLDTFCQEIIEFEVSDIVPSEI